MIRQVFQIRIGDLVAVDRLKGPHYPVQHVRRDKHDDSDVVRVDLGVAGVHYWWAYSGVDMAERTPQDAFSFPGAAYL